MATIHKGAHSAVRHAPAPATATPYSPFGIAWNLWLLGVVFLAVAVYAAIRPPKSAESYNALGATLVAYLALFLVTPNDTVRTALLIVGALLVGFFGINSVRIAERRDADLRGDRASIGDLSSEHKAHYALTQRVYDLLRQPSGKAQNDSKIRGVIVDSIKAAHAVWGLAVSAASDFLNRPDLSQITSDKIYDEMARTTRKNFDQYHRDRVENVVSGAKALGADTSEIESYLSDHALSGTYAEDIAMLLDNLSDSLLRKISEAK